MTAWKVDDVMTKAVVSVQPTASYREVEGADRVGVALTAGVVRLTGEVDRRSTANLAVRLTRQTPGVVEVIDNLQVAFEDTDTTGAGVFYVA